MKALEADSFRGIVTAKPVRAALAVSVIAKKKRTDVEEHGSFSFEYPFSNRRASGVGRILLSASRLR